MTDRNAHMAELIARNGGALPKVPLLDPETQDAVLTALAAGQTNYLSEDEKKRRQR